MFMGADGKFFWFMGVVENVKDDPLKLGRVQVRLWGIHTEEKIINESTGKGIPTEDLPWAYIMLPPTSASMNGIGQTPLGLVQGSHVIGFARDGETYNDLVIIGSVGGIPEELPNSEIGFFDPDEVYPKSDFLNEPDTNRLARNEKIDETIVKEKKDKRIKGITKAGGGNWNEKNVSYDAEYPYNKVLETESGHIVEFDDTKDAERINIHHKSGTFIEIHPDGSIQMRVEKDNYTVTLKDNNIYAKGDVNITSDGKTNIRASNVNLDADNEVLSLTGVKFEITSTAKLDLISAGIINLMAPSVKKNGKEVSTFG